MGLLGSLCLSLNYKPSHTIWMWDEKFHGAELVCVDFYSQRTHNANGNINMLETLSQQWWHVDSCLDELSLSRITSNDKWSLLTGNLGVWFLQLQKVVEYTHVEIPTHLLYQDWWCNLTESSIQCMVDNVGCVKVEDSAYWFPNMICSNKYWRRFISQDMSLVFLLDISRQMKVRILTD